MKFEELPSDDNNVVWNASFEHSNLSFVCRIKVKIDQTLISNEADAIVAYPIPMVLMTLPKN